MSKHNGENQSPEITPEDLTAFALGQLQGDELTRASAVLANRVGSAHQAEAQSIRALAAALAAAQAAHPLPPPSPQLRVQIEERLAQFTPPAPIAHVALPDRHNRFWRLTKLQWVAVGGICSILAALLLVPAVQSSRKSVAQLNGAFGSVRNGSPDNETQVPAAENSTPARGTEQQMAANPDGVEYQQVQPNELQLAQIQEEIADDVEIIRSPTPELLARINELRSSARPGLDVAEKEFEQVPDQKIAVGNETARVVDSLRRFEMQLGPAAADSKAPANGPIADLPSGPPLGQQTVPAASRLAASSPPPSAVAGGYGYGGRAGPPSRSLANSQSAPGVNPPSDSAGKPHQRMMTRNDRLADNDRKSSVQMLVKPRIIIQEEEQAQLGLDISSKELEQRRFPEALHLGFTPRPSREDSLGAEQYAPIVENPFVSPLTQPLSTFSIDVDTASYANARRFINSGRLPPPSAVRIEELVNYFRYDYQEPQGDQPFSVNMEVAECPWREGHLLLRVGLKGKEIARDNRPPSNLVFLLDVSGSMADENKLPLVKTAMQMLTSELGEDDRVSIVTYAGDAGLKLPSTRGHNQETILRAIESLSAGGSTNGSAGIELAYEQAAAYFVEGGANRVILCTDGDLNVGITDDEALVKLIKRKAAGGTFLTVLGFGEGNLKDAKMEKLADNGNGLYAYIDSVREARKVLVEQLTGSTITIAKDVKIQIEFNPAQVASYRLLGYENRVLAAQDFNNDKKDAGEIGAGHTVTALYELVPAGVPTDVVQSQPRVDPLKYQKSRSSPSENLEPGTLELSGADAAKSNELLTLKLRFKQPDGDTSKLLEYPLKDRGGSFHAASRDFQFAAAVASFGMILRGSEHRGTGNLAAALEIAGGALGEDSGGYRAEFLDLLRKASALEGR